MTQPNRAGDEPAIALAGVRKAYRGAVVLHDTDLVLGAGGSLAIVGASGSGKSTLLKLVMGLVTPDAGTVRVLGEAMGDATRLALRHRIGYVIQEGGLFPHLTAKRNVALMAEHLGWDAARTAARVEELRALVSLAADVLERYPAELSGGQRQRVGLMRALLLDPPLLLLDEPLGALDAIVRGRLQKDLRAIFERLGKAVLLVTHDIAEAGVLAAEVAVMDAGRVVQRGPMGELVARPATPFVRELLGGVAEATS
jgi:osmoprotectant transport system ATP-binding protein